MNIENGRKSFIFVGIKGNFNYIAFYTALVKGDIYLFLFSELIKHLKIPLLSYISRKTMQCLKMMDLQKLYKCFLNKDKSDIVKKGDW